LGISPHSSTRILNKLLTCNGICKMLQNVVFTDDL